MATITGQEKSEELGITIKGVNKIRGGEAFVEIKGENLESRKNLTEALKAALEDKGTTQTQIRYNVPITKARWRQ